MSTNGEFFQEEPDFDAQFEAFRAAIGDIFDETGLTTDEILDDEKTFEIVAERVRERLGAAGIAGLEADSLMLIELMISLEEDGGDGLAGDREPLSPVPNIGSGSTTLDIPRSFDQPVT